MEDGILYETPKGTPQGGVISPLLANLIGDRIDKELENAGYKFVRYADDFIVMIRKSSDLPKALAFVTEVVEKKLEMELNKDKTGLANFQRGFQFLGFRFINRYKGISQKSMDKLKDNIRQITKRTQGTNLKGVIDTLNPVIRGFVNYFHLADAKKKFRSLDKWIRRRLRSIKYQRKWVTDNKRFPNRRFRKMKLLSFEEEYLKDRARV